MQLQEVAKRLGCPFEGDPTLELQGVASLGESQPGDLSFISDIKYLPLLEQTLASAVLAPDHITPPTHLGCLRTSYPRLTFAHAIEIFYQPFHQAVGIHPSAVIAADVQLGEGVAIGPQVVIESGVSIGARSQIHGGVVIYPEVQIGQDCQLFANCVIHERSVIGDGCLIHSGAVIGDDGFGHVPQADGSWYRMLQSGIVVLEDGVDVGANVTIDRPAVGETRIGQGTKIDNLVQIGHGVQTGRHCVLVAQVGLAGGVELGQRVILGGQVGAAGHIQIGDGVTAVGQTGITGSIPPGQTIAGYPHQLHGEWRRTAAAGRRLPELLRTVRRLERRIRDLENQLGSEAHQD